MFANILHILCLIMTFTAAVSCLLMGIKTLITVHTSKVILERYREKQPEGTYPPEFKIEIDEYLSTQTEWAVCLFGGAIICGILSVLLL